MDRCPPVTLAVVVISALLAGCGGIATPSSNQQTGATQTPKRSAKAYRTPPGRTNPAMAYDPRTHEVLMVGGMIGNTPLSDMWAWDGMGWSELLPATLPAQPAFAPSSESPSFMAYDARTRQMVMVAIGQAPPDKARTWIWDGHNWSERHPGDGSPGAGAITYDASLEKILMMVADFSHGNPIGMTWAWDGTNWAPIQTPHVVDNPQLGVGSLTYDAATRQVLYLTQVAKPSFKDITWIFDGQDWTRSPASTPLGAQVQLVYDDASASLLYIGGNAEFLGQPSGGSQTWSWDGNSWHRVSDTAPATFGQGGMGGGATAAYDAARRQVVLFGGIAPDGSLMNETWIWDGKSWTQRG